MPDGDGNFENLCVALACALGTALIALYVLLTMVTG
jgi:hypothetical protein